MSVAEAKTKISRREFIQWQIYLAIDPEIERRMDFHSAHQIGSIANMFRKKGSRPLTIGEILLEFDSTPKKQDKKEIKRALNHFARVHNKLEKQMPEKRKRKRSRNRKLRNG